MIYYFERRNKKRYSRNTLRKNYKQKEENQEEKEREKENKVIKINNNNSNNSNNNNNSNNKYLKEVLKLKKTINHWDDLFSDKIKENRMEDWIRIEVLGEPLLQKYAWAIPNYQAIQILKKFSPIIEIGAGKGYWASLMEQEGINVQAYDLYPPSKCWTKVKKGDPSILSTKKSKLPSNTTLFLCYPDQGSSVGLECLNHILESTSSDSSDSSDSNNSSYCQYIIHVGELIHTGCASGAPQAPWGRSSSPDFQVKLSELYHCILTLPLLSFPFSRDFLTVWKRTRHINMKEEDQNNDNNDNDDNDDSNKQEDEDDEDEWADIPDNERIFDNQKCFVSRKYEYLLEEE